MPALAAANDIYRVRTTTNDLIQEALEMLGVLAEGEVLNAGQLANSLRSLNYMLDSWNTEKLVIYVLARNTFTLTLVNPQEIAPGSGVLNAPRPNRIEPGTAWLTGGQLGDTEKPIQVLPREQWNGYYRPNTSGIPCVLYYEPLMPNAQIWFDVTPDAAYTLVLYLEQMLAQIFMDGVNAEIVLPPGYAEAISTNLAIRLAPKYGKSATLEIINNAVESKARIKRLNQKPIWIQHDPALAPYAGGTCDIVRGDL